MGFRLESFNKIQILSPSSLTGNVKFVVIEVSNFRGAKRCFLRNSLDPNLKAILNDIQEDINTLFEPVAISYVGGGKIQYNPHNRQIDIWDSDGHLKNDECRQKVIQFLKTVYSGYDIELQTPR